MKSIFETADFSEIKNRLNNLSDTSERQWGKMTPSQMAHHCQGPLNIMLEKVDYGFKPNWLAKVFFKKSLYSDKLWKKNMFTPKQFRETEPRDFSKELQALESLIDEAGTQKDKSEWNPHPGFGHFTAAQWGQMQYKHLDHHFRQFGI